MIKAECTVNDVLLWIDEATEVLEEDRKDPKARMVMEYLEDLREFIHNGGV